MLDLMLPAVSGIEILREIKKLHPKTDVIIITSHASVETAVEALRLGAQDYLDKPFEDLGIVSEVIKRVFEKRRIIEENEHLNQDLKTKNFLISS
jgi:DNA-binding NtrC family response regulator